MAFNRRMVILVALLPLASLVHAQTDHAPRLIFPVDCRLGDTCVIQNFVDHNRTGDAQDYRCGALTYHGHDGTDIRIPSLAIMRRGVNVLAAADGAVLRVRDGVPDQSIRAPTASAVDGHECGNAVILDHGHGWQTQYCHMALGSVAVKQGATVKRGDVIGRVGLSGQTEFPHLHLTVRHNGRVMDPFTSAPQSTPCGGAETSLLALSSGDGAIYHDAFVLNHGFIDGPIDLDAIETGEIEANRPTAQSAALLAYIRVVGLKAGDVQHMMITNPDGTILIDKVFARLDRPKAQNSLYIGQKRPTEVWPKGRYTAIYEVIRAGSRVTKDQFSLEF